MMLMSLADWFPFMYVSDIIKKLLTGLKITEPFCFFIKHQNWVVFAIHSAKNTTVTWRRGMKRRRDSFFASRKVWKEEELPPNYLANKQSQHFHHHFSFWVCILSLPPSARYFRGFFLPFGQFVGLYAKSFHLAQLATFDNMSFFHLESFWFSIQVRATLNDWWRLSSICNLHLPFTSGLKKGAKNEWKMEGPSLFPAMHLSHCKILGTRRPIFYLTFHNLLQRVSKVSHLIDKKTRL